MKKKMNQLKGIWTVVNGMGKAGVLNKVAGKSLQVHSVHLKGSRTG